MSGHRAAGAGRASRSAAAVLAGSALLGAVLTGCSAGPGDRAGGAAAPAPSAASTRTVPAVPGASPAPSGPAYSALGVTVRGGFGARPALRVPAGAAVPADRRVQVLSRGRGPAVTAGDLVVAGYHRQTWGSASAPSVVLDDSWARGLPAIVVAGRVTDADEWADLVVGQPVGSRLLVVAPAGAGRTATGTAPGAVAVVLDVLDVVDQVGPGRAVKGLPGKGFPTVEGTVGAAPKIGGLAAVGQPARRSSQLLVTGAGPRVDPKKSLVVHLVQVDATTGRTVNSTWGGTPMLMPGRVLGSTVDALATATVGSRAVAVLPASGGTHPRVLVVDVVDQV